MKIDNVKVVKRDGIKHVKFSTQRIRDAIKMANGDATVPASEKISDEKIDKVVDYVVARILKLFAKTPEGETAEIDVENIQNIVEEALMNKNCYSVARAYITFRDKASKARFRKAAIVKEMNEKLNGSNIVNANANMDEASFGGRKGEMASAYLKEDALDYRMSEKAARNHRNNRIYTHDLDSFSLGLHNCLSIPMDDLLREGFSTRQVYIRPARSASTALQLVVVLMQLQSLQEFGGVSATHLDWTLVPYIRMSFRKHYIVAYLKDTEGFINLDLLQMLSEDIEQPVYDKNGNLITTVKYTMFDTWVDAHKEEFFAKAGLKDEDFRFDNVANLDKKYYQSALYDTILEVKQAVEGLFHNLNSLQSRSGNQLPFSSINYGTCTSEEGRLLTRSILQTSIRGVGNGRTSIFPCQIFQYKDTINGNPDSPNYDLFQLAIRSTAKRMYPNYANVDWSNNNDEKSFQLKREFIASLSDEERAKMSDILKDNQLLQSQFALNADLTPIEYAPNAIFSTMGCLSGNEHLYIKEGDNVSDCTIHDFFEYCKGNTSEVQLRPAVPLFNAEKLDNEANKADQSKSGIVSGAGVYAITYLPNDVTYIGSSSDVCRRFAEHKSNIKLHGALDAGPSFGDSTVENYRFEVLEYTDDFKAAEKKYIEENVTINVKGTSQKYYKVLTHSSSVAERPTWELYNTVPQELIDLEARDIKVLDIDGKWVKVRHVFKNDKRSSPYMMHIWYKEFDKTYCISATEDHPFFNGSGFTKASDLKVGDKLYRADGMELPIVEVAYHWEAVDSYDIGTESGTFVGSDIKMHNCRTANGYDINWFDDWKTAFYEVLGGKKLDYRFISSGQQKDGRGNICPATIIMPTIAMEAKHKAERNGHPEYVVENFMSLLEDAIEDCKDSLIERFNWIAAQPAASASFMYDNSTMYGYKKEEGIRSALKHGTLAIGQIGLAETLQILIGCDHTEEKGMELAKRIEQLFKDKANEYKEQYHLNFGVYMTPAESLATTSMAKFVKKYGLIENVSAYRDESGKLVPREYFTNSIHIPVWKEIDPFEKIDREAILCKFSSAGCITYVEIGDNAENNLSSLEDMVRYAMKRDVPYFALNLKICHCNACGYDGSVEFDSACPCCGAGPDMIEILARVTGYLSTTVSRMIIGKQYEVKDRYVHVNNLADWRKKA